MHIDRKNPIVTLHLEDFVEEVNFLFEHGIFVERYQKIIYPVITLNLFDLVGRHLFLYGSFFNSLIYGCLRCLALGVSCETHKGHSHIFLPNETADLRDLRLHRGINRLIENGESTPILGVCDVSPLSKIKDQNYLISTSIEPMHLFCRIIKKILQAFLQERNYTCFVKKELKKVAEKRIKRFSRHTYNTILKRPLDKLEEIPKNKWKSNQFLQFFLYAFPVIFKNILDKNVYLHCIIFIYIISNLWSKLEEDLDLNYIERLIDFYLILIEQFYRLSSYTPNHHQLKHIVEHYKNHSKFSLNNGFLFEHLNGVINNQPKSPYGVLEQISEKSEMSFARNAKSASIKNKSRIFKTNNKEDKITSIYNDYFTLTSKRCKNKSKDYFIMTHDHRFYIVLNFFKENNCIFFKGQELKIDSNFQCNLDFSDLDLDTYDDFIDIHFNELNLDYMFNVQKVSQTVNLNVNNIKEKILYCPKFKDNTDKFEDKSKGLVIRNIIEFHN